MKLCTPVPAFLMRTAWPPGGYRLLGRSRCRPVLFAHEPTRRDRAGRSPAPRSDGRMPRGRGLRRPTGSGRPAAMGARASCFLPSVLRVRSSSPITSLFVTKSEAHASVSCGHRGQRPFRLPTSRNIGMRVGRNGPRAMVSAARFDPWNDGSTSRGSGSGSASLSARSRVVVGWLSPLSLPALSSSSSRPSCEADRQRSGVTASGGETSLVLETVGQLG